jgi:hypothetical protein
MGWGETNRQTVGQIGSAQSIPALCLLPPSSRTHTKEVPHWESPPARTPLMRPQDTDTRFVPKTQPQDNQQGSVVPQCKPVAARRHSGFPQFRRPPRINTCHRQQRASVHAPCAPQRANAAVPPPLWPLDASGAVYLTGLALIRRHQGTVAVRAGKAPPMVHDAFGLDASALKGQVAFAALGHVCAEFLQRPVARFHWCVPPRPRAPRGAGVCSVAQAMWNEQSRRAWRRRCCRPAE